MIITHIPLMQTDQPRGFEPAWMLKGTLCGDLPGKTAINFQIGSWEAGKFEANCDHCTLIKTTVIANIGTDPGSLLVPHSTWKKQKYMCPVNALRLFAWHILGKPRKGPRFEQDLFVRWVNNDGFEHTLRYAQARENAPRGCWNCCVPILEVGLCPVCTNAYSSRDVMQLNKPR